MDTPTHQVVSAVSWNCDKQLCLASVGTVGGRDIRTTAFYPNETNIADLAWVVKQDRRVHGDSHSTPAASQDSAGAPRTEYAVGIIELKHSHSIGTRADYLCRSRRERC